MRHPGTGSAERGPVLFVSLPESGLLNTMLVLARELASRGVPDLWFATDDHRRADIEAIDRSNPVRFVPLGEVVSEMSATGYDEETYRKVTQPSRFKSHRAAIEHTFDPNLQVPKYRALSAAVDRIEPALLVIDVICTYAVDLAITRGIPYVLSNPFLPSMWLSAHVPFATSHTPSSFPTPHTGFSQRMSPRQRIENRLFRWRTLAIFLSPRMSRALRAEGQIRRQLGIDPRARRSMARVNLAELVLCYSLAELDYPFPLPANLALTGALTPPLPEAPEDRDDPDGVACWLDSHESVVYIGLGTLTRLRADELAAVVAAARRLSGRHAVLWKLSAEQQRLLPPRDEWPDTLRIEDWVPSQLDVLAHSNVVAFVTHAGSNGFHEGIYFGTPLVMRPLWVDCWDEAVRGEDLGVGVTLDHPHTVDADDLVDKVTRVTSDPAYRRRATELGVAQRAAGGRVAAADRLLALPALTGSVRPETPATSRPQESR
ncbi:MGT family glycosyltransferase [Amycolatopsis antarctica]|uniref:MGT family glycosyltransferase n=1 Tax=Amycolatopsis antarctica TaxID=1854586 RepID=A0A263D6R2_9PSEU|nr:glycosyltransferase [Amycolatopsis antarctica]OZM74150.1 MGT family glycosyltransferase [Amycolatopsis antarctica]